MNLMAGNVHRLEPLRSQDKPRSHKFLKAYSEPGEKMLQLRPSPYFKFVYAA